VKINIRYGTGRGYMVQENAPPAPFIDRTAVIVRLRELAALKTGDPPPQWLPVNQWAEAIGELCGQAADLIEEEDRR